MNDLPRQKLIEIVERHGKSIVEDARRAEGLFRDNFGGFKREVSVLTMAIEEGVARDLAIAPRNAPLTILLARLKQRLIDNLALSEDAAKWAVNSWAIALRVISNDDLITTEQNNSGKAQPSYVPDAVETQPVIHNHSNLPKQNSTNDLIVVSASNNGDFVSISEAIKAAKNGSRILVHPGLYEENLIINKQIEIIGDGDTKDIIVRSRNFSCVLMQSDQAVLKNLTFQCLAGQQGTQFFCIDIHSGKLNLQNCDVTSDSLACIAVHGANTNPLIQNCQIHDSSDGGIYFFDDAAGVIEKCDIYRNQNTSVVIAQNANPTFKNCRIAMGENSGFWVYENGLGTIDDCIISGHQQAEIVVTRGGSPVLRGCEIHNSNNSGILVQENGSALLENCRIYENADAGISINAASIAAISNCRITSNGTVAVRVRGESSVRVENSDLTGNGLATWETEEGVFVENNNNREY